MMQSLIVPYSYYNGYIVGTGAKRQLYAIAAGTTVANGFIQNDRGWNVYFYRKFVPIEDMGGAITNRNHTPINFPVIRFADVLLMLAEAYNEDNQLETEEFRIALYDCIDHLPDRSREVLLLHRVKGLKQKEISEKLSISVKTIKNLIWMSLQKLKECLEMKEV